MYSLDLVSEDRLLGKEVELEHRHIPSTRLSCRWSIPLYSWICQLAFFTLSLFIFLTGVRSRYDKQPCDCDDHLPMYSPALEAIKGTGHMQRFDGSFATPNAFKGTPKPDIDAAWAEITYEDGMLLTNNDEDY